MATYKVYKKYGTRNRRLRRYQIEADTIEQIRSWLEYHELFEDEIEKFDFNFADEDSDYHCTFLMKGKNRRKDYFLEKVI